ncbi:hypothetical protein NOR_07543 [Metarhizium rileyi]|uniref:Uncharacterized protein n=1 Tax=Metarhizium rileyi (strain RCEF 4871) TaxID=1649241 RepID=A0A166Y2S5_METRR|nr:hypothetical protein NOR_07543 [Metarhizium rileyi RCEF 4871]TWU70829.1 hypothetical protein ED733_000717 [Metarhizium rileyi]
MRFTSVTLLLASLASGIRAAAIDIRADQAAGFVGTFDTFTDTACSVGGEGVSVNDVNTSGVLPQETRSVRAYITSPSNLLVIWVHGGNWYPLVIRPGDPSCHVLDGPGRSWNIATI